TPAAQAEIRAELYAALSQLLEQDFAAGEPYLGEYRGLCEVAVPETATPEERAQAAKERQRRHARLHLLLARGRGRQNRLPEAPRSYLDYSALAPADLMAVPGDASLRVRPERWVQGQLAALYRRAGPEDRRAFDEEVAHRLETARRGDTAALRRLVAL